MDLIYDDLKFITKLHLHVPHIVGFLLKSGEYMLYRIFGIIFWNYITVVDYFTWPLIISSIFIIQIDIELLIVYSSVCHIQFIIGDFTVYF